MAIYSPNNTCTPPTTCVPNTTTMLHDVTKPTFGSTGYLDAPQPYLSSLNGSKFETQNMSHGMHLIK